MCLIKRIKQAQQGNVAGAQLKHTCWQLPHSSQCCCIWCKCSLTYFPAGRMVRPKCEEAVAAYKVERSKHINKDPALGECLACHSSSNEYHACLYCYACACRTA